MKKGYAGEQARDTSTEIVIDLPIDMLEGFGRYAGATGEAGNSTNPTEISSAAAIGRVDHFPCTRKGARGDKPRLQLVLPGRPG